MSWQPRLIRRSLKGAIVAALLIAWAVVPTAAWAATAPAASSGISGVWAFTTNDTPDNLVHFTLFLRQQGTRIVGVDTGGEPVLGSVTGQTFTFTVYGVSSEDDYGGQGTLGPGGRFAGGSFWDGFGFSGAFVAVKLA